jgi:phosphatidylserine/phosphatidylglycerophosphate/cardiolipin synthase-like enzyme
MCLSRSLALLLIFIALFSLSSSLPAEARRKKKESIVETMANRLADTIDAALVKPPVDEEVCFSPDDPCDIKLIKFVDSAQGSIEVAIFDINRDELVHHLLVQARKIPVRVLVDQRQAKGEHSLVPLLIKVAATAEGSKLQIRIGRQRGIMHNKFTIVDGKMIETGSFNYTNSATDRNNENQIYLAKPSIVDRYKKRFEEIWSVGKPAG